MKVTEIFDVTDADSSALLNPEEKMLNTQLQYDDDWDEAITGSWMSAQPSMAEEGVYSFVKHDQNGRCEEHFLSFGVS